MEGVAADNVAGRSGPEDVEVPVEVYSGAEGAVVCAAVLAPETELETKR